VEGNLDEELEDEGEEVGGGGPAIREKLSN